MNVCILHGYGLNRSGSNIYVNNIAKKLSEKNITIHVVCQEFIENLPSYFTDYLTYDEHGNIVIEKKLVENPKTRVILHRPFLGDVLPVYNWDKYPGFPEVKTFLEINNSELENYLSYTTSCLESVVKNWKVDIVHTNHMVMMPEVARRVKEKLQTPFIVTPHGSAIEYVIKKSERYLSYGKEALKSCDSVIVGGSEMTERLSHLWGKGTDSCFLKKIEKIPTGSNLSLFKPVEKRSEPKIINVDEDSKSCSKKMMDELYNELAGSTDQDQILTRVEAFRNQYEPSCTDKDYKEKLSQVDWTENDVICFSGKQIVGKGIHCLMASLAYLENVHAIIAGEGSFREGLELLLRSIVKGDYNLFKTIIEIGWAFDNKPQAELIHLKKYKDPDNFKDLFLRAKETRLFSRVHFLGYLKHENLSNILKNSTLSILPSIIKEAYPLSLVESLAVGIPPLATTIGGSKVFLEEISDQLPENFTKLGINADEEFMVESIVERVKDLSEKKQYIPLAEAREIALKNFGWSSITDKMIDHYKGIAK